MALPSILPFACPPCSSGRDMFPTHLVAVKIRLHKIIEIEKVAREVFARYPDRLARAFNSLSYIRQDMFGKWLACIDQLDIAEARKSRNA